MSSSRGGASCTYSVTKHLNTANTFLYTSAVQQWQQFASADSSLAHRGVSKLAPSTIRTRRVAAHARWQQQFATAAPTLLCVVAHSWQPTQCHCSYTAALVACADCSCISSPAAWFLQAVGPSRVARCANCARSASCSQPKTSTSRRRLVSSSSSSWWGQQEQQQQQQLYWRRGVPHPTFSLRGRCLTCQLALERTG